MATILEEQAESLTKALAEHLEQALPLNRLSLPYTGLNWQTHPTRGFHEETGHMQAEMARLQGRRN